MDKIKLLEKKEFKDSFIYTLETGFSGILSIAFYIFIANFLTTSEVGAYSLSLVYASIVAGIANLGLSKGYERTFFEYVNDLQKKGSLIFSVQIFSLTSIFFMIFLGIFFSKQISTIIFGNESYQSLWIIILIGVNISEFSKFYFLFLRNTRQANLYSLMHFIQVVINFFLAYIFLAVLEKELYWLGVALLLSHGIILIISLFHQFNNLPIIINHNQFIKVAKISLPLTPRIFIGFIGSQFDKIILSQVVSLGALGVYSVAHRIAMSTYMFINAVGRVWTPKLYESLFQKDLASDTSFLTIYMYISLFPSLFLILFAQEVMMVFPKSYGWGYIVVVLLTLYYSLLFIGKVNGEQLIFAKKSWLTSGLSLVNIIVVITISYPLVILYGAIGAALGMLVSGIIMGIISFFFADKYAPIFWDYKKILYLFLIIIIAAIFVFIIPDNLTPFIIQLFIKFSILVIFLYMLLRLNK